MELVITIEDIPESFGNAEPPASIRRPGVWLYTPCMIRKIGREYDLCLYWQITNGYVHWLNGFKDYELELFTYPETDGERIFFTTADLDDAQTDWEMRPINDADLASVMGSSGIARRDGESAPAYAFRAQNS
jgi:hypothetical protein